MTKTIFITIQILGHIWLNAQKVENKSSNIMETISINNVGEKVLYFEGKLPTFTKKGLPYIYIYNYSKY